MKRKLLKIGVLSDTHCRSLNDLPPIVLKRLEGVDAIIHAGDAQYCSFLKELEKIAPVYSVRGNHDKNWKTFPLENALVLEVNGFTIGVTHGHLGEGRHTVDRVLNTFNLNEVDMIIYGHNHKDTGVHQRGRTLLLNPGSPTDTRQPFSSMAVMWVGKNIDVRMTRWSNENPKNKSNRKRKQQPKAKTRVEEKAERRSPKGKFQGRSGARNEKTA